MFSSVFQVYVSIFVCCLIEFDRIYIGVSTAYSGIKSSKSPDKIKLEFVAIYSRLFNIVSPETKG